MSALPYEQGIHRLPVIRRFALHFLVMILRLILFLVLAGSSVASLEAALDFKQWELLPIQEGGRTKPIDTFAQETVVRLTGGSTITAFNRTWRPSEFILSLLLDTNREWGKEPILLVSYHPLAEKLRLDPQRHLFSLEELGHATALEQLVKEAHEVRDTDGKPDLLHQEAEDVAGRMSLFAHIESGDAFLIVPPQENPNGIWLLPPDFAKFYTESTFDPVKQNLQSMASAFLAQDALAFSSHTRELRFGLRSLSPQIYPNESAMEGERLYNHLHAFDDASFCYILGLILIGLSLLFGLKGNRARIIGLIATGVGLVFHITGIVLRCWIGGRPPVTNMYESMVWVSIGVLVISLFFFLRYRTWVYLLAALPVSITLLMIVGQFPLILSKNIDPLVPVLRNNYWLTVHVLTITLSYATFFLAMGLAHIILFRYLRKPEETAADTDMHFWLYRVLQLGVLLLAAGTILGGVWANYSWGRFWGWDPKETWALITLLCYVLVLHGRLAGWWNDFGLVIGSVICFLSVVMAWYGVNFVLGTGLHSYGFGYGGQSYVIGIVGVDLVFVIASILRYQRVLSLRKSVGNLSTEPLTEIS